MGHSESKHWPVPSSLPTTPSGSLKRSSRRKSRPDQIEDIASSTKTLKNDILKFQGRRASTGYIQFQRILANSANHVQEIKKKRKSAYEIGRCNEILDDINDCYTKLEQKVVGNDEVLDMGAVESSSFINVNNNGKSPKRKRVKRESITNLEILNRRVQVIEDDVKRALSSEDHARSSALQNEIEQLLVKLEMVVTDRHTTIHDQKEALGKKLIRYHNQLRKLKKQTDAKKDSYQQFQDPDNKRNSYQQLDDLINTEEALTILEGKVSDFKGIPGEQLYKELEQQLESHWTKLYSLDVMGDEDKNRKADDNEKVKRILQELRSRAGENEKERRSLEEIKSIETQLQGLKVAVGNIDGKKGKGYVQVDQSLRELWAALTNIYDSTDRTKSEKNRLVSEIQKQLKILSGGPDEQSQLIKQVDEFHSYANRFIQNLDTDKLASAENLKEVTRIVEMVILELQKKLDNLKAAEEMAISNEKLLKRVQNVVLRKQVSRDSEQRSEEIQKRMSQMQLAQFEVTKEINAFHKILADAKDLQNSIIASKCFKGDQQYCEFERTLNLLQQKLDSMPHTRNSELIGHNRKKAAEAILDALKHLDEKPSGPTQSEALQKVMDIDAGVQYLRQQINSFTGTSRDSQYNKIESELVEHRKRLIEVEPDTGGAVEIPVQELERQIVQYQQELNTKAAENQTQRAKSASEQLKDIVEEAQKIKQQIDRFSGTFRGIQFRTISNRLKACLDTLESVDVKGDANLSYAKQQVKQKVTKYYQFLEDRSNKPETVVNKLPHVHINELRDKLVVIKNKTESFNGTYKDGTYKKIEEALDKCNEELKLIDDCGHKSVRLSKVQYEDYIKKLLKYFEEKTIATQGDEQVNAMKELDIIEADYNKLKRKTVSFDGIYDDESYVELEELLVKIMLRIDNVNPGDIPQVTERRKILLASVQAYAKEFEDSIKGTKIIDEILGELNMIGQNVSGFAGNRTSPEYVLLDEALISLMVRLDSVEYGANEKLKKERDSAVRDVQRYMKVLEQRVKKT